MNLLICYYRSVEFRSYAEAVVGASRFWPLFDVSVLIFAANQRSEPLTGPLRGCLPAANKAEPNPAIVRNMGHCLLPLQTTKRR